MKGSDKLKMLSNNQLKFHYHPQKGWMNDPNGLCSFRGEYHLFYQHCPEYEIPWKESMHWGHCVTNDFLNFKELPVALFPDEHYDCGGVWSGTAISHEDKLYLFYASVDENGKQTISVAMSEDGMHFEKYEGNPVISQPPADGSKDFRDPAILVTENGKYLVIASADRKKNTGNVLLYKSDDLFSWEYVGVLIEYENAKYCECPSFVCDGDEYILSVSVVPNELPHYFEVMKGSFDGSTFKPRIVSHFQKGPHEYAGQIFRDSQNRNILISWVPGWDFQPEEKCIGCLSIPLEIKEKDNKLLAYPVDELKHLVDENGSIIDAYIKEEFINEGEEVEITLTEKP